MTRNIAPLLALYTAIDWGGLPGHPLQSGFLTKATRWQWRTSASVDTGYNPHFMIFFIRWSSVVKQTENNRTNHMLHPPPKHPRRSRCTLTKQHWQNLRSENISGITSVTKVFINNWRLKGRTKEPERKMKTGMWNQILIAVMGMHDGKVESLQPAVANVYKPPNSLWTHKGNKGKKNMRAFQIAFSKGSHHLVLESISLFCPSKLVHLDATSTPAPFPKIWHCQRGDFCWICLPWLHPPVESQTKLHKQELQQEGPAQEGKYTRKRHSNSDSSVPWSMIQRNSFQPFLMPFPLCSSKKGRVWVTIQRS